MAVVVEVTKYSIIDMVKAYNRLDNFGYEGWQKLFEYMENLSDDLGEPIELDVVAWCCDYSMYESVQDFRDAFHMDLTNEEWEEMDEEEKLEAIENYLRENTSVVTCQENLIIWQVF